MYTKPTVLVIISAYLPGFKSGGPLRSIVNSIEKLSDEFQFLVITADRDLGDKQPYPSVTQNAWQTVGKAKVYYCTPECMTYHSLTQIIKETPHDILYLNSFFSIKTSFFPLLGRRLQRFQHQPVILAPRGQFSEGAFHIKAFRKRLFLIIGKALRLWKDLDWQASTEHERADVIKVVNPPFEDIKIACNLPSPPGHKLRQENTFSLPLKVLFLSRIAPKKNLDYALKCLKSVNHPVDFTIYGPAEDQEYWMHCLNLSRFLPKHVKVYWEGSVTPENVPLIIARHHLLFFPTRGENYGHVISEAISAGTPVLISDTTPWRNLEKNGIGRELPLNNRQAFSDYIDQVAELSVEEYKILRDNVIEYANSLMNEGEDIEANRKLFRDALKEKHR